MCMLLQLVQYARQGFALLLIQHSEKIVLPVQSKRRYSFKQPGSCRSETQLIYPGIVPTNLSLQETPVFQPADCPRHHNLIEIALRGNFLGAHLRRLVQERKNAPLRNADRKTTAIHVSK